MTNPFSAAKVQELEQYHGHAAAAFFLTSLALL